ncbi:hypothetical protein BGZ74_000216 [Mortierella antarctica]|nr:hypothetical protein BGZ74_000216 [Mortierella antarctica]
MARSTATPKPKVYLAATQLPLTYEEIDYLSKPRVLIAGAGIGGLTLAVLLTKAGIPYQVFEKSYEVKPLGSAIILGSGAGALLEQMEIYDEFVELGKHATKMDIYNGNLKPGFTMDYGWLEKVTTYREYVISRPDLYGLLWRQIPRECILLGKRVLSFQETGDGITVRCSDNSEYQGDILVGADGAYSAVRQHLFKNLKATGDLPSVDDVPLPFSCVCLVGQTTVLDPEDFPDLKSEFCKYYSILGVQNMCTTAKMNDSFRTSEWGPEAAEAMCKEFRHFKVPGGKDGQVLTLGDYIDRSPKEYIAKVMLEEIVFQTWHGGRTVLMGDGGAGALTAMHDAVTLANWICTLEAPSPSEIEDIFKEYRAERYPVAKEAFETSQVFTKTLGKREV